MADKSSTAPQSLTDVKIRGLTNTSEKRLEIRDTGVTGLILRVTPKNAKSFSVSGRLICGKQIQITIGKYPEVSLKEARDTARDILAEFRRGNDPRETKKRAKAKASADELLLKDLLDEAEGFFAPTKAVWRAGLRQGRKKAEARAAIDNVFSELIDKPLLGLELKDFSKAAGNYTPLRPIKGKASANGAAARALAYLRPVFDWASCRNGFSKENAGRTEPLDLPDIARINDPSVDDPTLEGKRERVLTQPELEAVLPVLTFPAPTGMRPTLAPDQDYGPVAFLFALFTISRREEVVDMRCKDVNLREKTWTKTVKTRRKPGSIGPAARRTITVPLSDDAVSLLLSLPSVRAGEPDDFVFPSSAGGRLQNWDRTQQDIHRATGTTGWHRHDLRRTGATILQALGVAVSDIDFLLGHVSPLDRVGASSSIQNYVVMAETFDAVKDLKREAVNKLAAFLNEVRRRGEVSATTLPETVPNEPKLRASKPSPWATAAK